MGSARISRLRCKRRAGLQACARSSLHKVITGMHGPEATTRDAGVSVLGRIHKMQQYVDMCRRCRRKDT